MIYWLFFLHINLLFIDAIDIGKEKSGPKSDKESQNENVATDKEPIEELPLPHR